jgi:hypothetical protein
LTRYARPALASAAPALLALWTWASAEVAPASTLLAHPVAEDVATALARPVLDLGPAHARPPRRLVRGRRPDPQAIPDEAPEPDAREQPQQQVEVRFGGFSCISSKGSWRWIEVRSAGIPEASREAARALQVGGPVLKEAFDALVEVLCHRKEGAASEKLAKHGAEGFRALVALLRGGLADEELDVLLTRTFVAGEEGVLLDAARAVGGKPERLAPVLVRLGAVDTPLVRDYLLDRLDFEHDARVVAAAAVALARLGETRAMGSCAQALRNAAWSGALRRTIADAMVRIDARAAAARFVDHLRHPDLDFLDGVIEFLAGVDAVAAAREADLLLHGRLADCEDPKRRAHFERFAGAVPCK